MPEIGTAQTLFRQHAHDFTNKLLINHRLTETLWDGIPQCTPHRRERAASNVIQLSARDVQVISRQSSGTLANSQLVLMHGPASTGTSSAVAAGQHRRHQADRGRPRAGLGHLGRERHHRRRQPSSPSRRGTPSDDGEHGAAAGSRDAWSTVGQDPGTMSAPTRRPPGRHRTARLPHQRRLLPVRSFPRPTSRVRSSRTRGSRARRWAARVSAGRRRSVRRRVRLPGTSQPKFDVRVDQELSNGGQFSYSGGVAATEGLSHTGVGSLDIQRGSYLGYGKLGYTQGDFRFQVFTNIMDGDAPNLLAPPQQPRPASAAAVQGQDVRRRSAPPRSSANATC